LGGKTSSESKMKYNAKAFDRVYLIVRKGLKEEIQKTAVKRGFVKQNGDPNINNYINALIETDINATRKGSEA